MYNKEDLKRHIRALGIKSDDVVSLHISLRSVGKIEGKGARVVIEALRECLTDGLLLVPAHTWAYCNPGSRSFDMRCSMPCVGAVPLVAVQMANEAYDAGDKTVLRSKHPTHSVVAFGKRAAEWTADDERATTPAPPRSSYGKLVTTQAKVLLVGVGHDSDTFFHAVDEALDIPDRLEAPFTLQFRDYDGSVTERHTSGHSCSVYWDVSAFYPNYEPALDEAGTVTYGRFGDALARVMDTQKAFEVVKALWAKYDHDLCVKPERLSLKD